MTENAAGAVLGLLGDLRKRVGVIKAKKKDGVKFKVRSAEDLADKLRAAACEVGLLIYPVHAEGKGHVVEDGTLAEVNLVLRIQAISDGSYLDVAGFGLGADNQDKAGGKASTYAWKAALIQTLLAGGAEDTDDTDTPIKGGVRPRAAGKPTAATVKAALEAVQAGDEAAYKAAIVLAKQLAPEDQLGLVDLIKATKAHAIPQPA